MNSWSDPVVIVAVASVIVAIVAVVIAVLGYRRNKEIDHVDFGEWKGEVNTDRDHFKTFMEEMRVEMREIRNSIEKLFIRPTLPPSSSQPITNSSPLSLTDFGEKIASDLHASYWVTKEAPKVWSYVQTLIEDYDVQEYCFQHVRRYLSDEMRTRVKRIAFERGTDIEGVYNVLAIVLRDSLLEKRKSGEGLSPTRE